MQVTDEVAGRAPTGPTPAGTDGRVLRRRIDAPLLVLAAVLVLAFVFFVNLGRRRWIYWDEWDFLAGRSAWNFDDLMQPHNEHWQPLPILAYRALFTVFGLRSYVPFLVVAVVLHLVVALLLWFVMRRAGVHEWVATAAASLFALFGAGHTNVVWAFQIGFVGSVAFGLAHLLLADHDGPFDRRDAAGLVAGLGALMCSGVGVAMVAAVAVAVLVRRGWQVALAHALPLAAIFLGWFATFGHDHYRQVDVQFGDMLRFVDSGLRADFDAIGHYDPVVWLLVLGTVAGAVMVAISLRREPARRRSLAAPLGLVAGAILFLAITSTGRAALGPASARAGRYVHVTTAMLLPAIAVAGTALVRRWRLVLPAVLAVLLVGVPASLGDASDAQRAARRLEGHSNFRATISDLARHPLAKEVPRSLRPVQNAAPEVTVGWLLDAAAAGRLPGVPPLTDARRETIGLQLSLQQTGARTGELVSCTPLTEPRRRRLEGGKRLGVRGAVAVRSGRTGRDDPRSLFYGTSMLAPATEHVLTAVRGPLVLELRPLPSRVPKSKVALCGVRSPSSR
jgi:hypothetical protein